MNAIRVKRRVDSETVNIPELRTMMGRDVEIIVIDQSASDDHAKDPVSQIDPHAFWKSKTIDELAAEQGIVGPTLTLDSPNASAFTAEDFDGFEETLDQWRAEK